MEKTLREHLSEAGKARWKNKTAEEKKAHAIMMVEARRKKIVGITARENTGENGNGLAVGAVSQEKTNEPTSTGGE